MRKRYRLRGSMIVVATAAAIAVLSLAVKSIAEAVGEGARPRPIRPPVPRTASPT